MIRQNCPFCGHRWIRKRNESPVVCPKCKQEFFPEDFMEIPESIEKR